MALFCIEFYVDVFYLLNLLQINKCALILKSMKQLLFISGLKWSNAFALGIFGLF